MRRKAKLRRVSVKPRRPMPIKERAEKTGRDDPPSIRTYDLISDLPNDGQSQPGRLVPGFAAMSGHCLCCEREIDDGACAMGVYAVDPYKEGKLIWSCMMVCPWCARNPEPKLRARILRTGLRRELEKCYESADDEAGGIEADETRSGHIEYTEHWCRNVSTLARACSGSLVEYCPKVGERITA